MKEENESTTGSDDSDVASRCSGSPGVGSKFGFTVRDRLLLVALLILASALGLETDWAFLLL